jgi:trimeric autotransporter adhesin
MKNKPVNHLLNAASLLATISVIAASQVFASTPTAPNLLAPANGASLTVPFSNSWAAATDPDGIAAYNWEVSPSSTFNLIILQNSTFPNQTQDAISGLPNGTYYWRVQAVNNAFVTGPWSAAQGFTVTGANAAEPAAPVLNPPQGYNTFHPFEGQTWTWSSVPGAATYTLEFSSDPNFPVLFDNKFDNLDNPIASFAIGDQGTFYMRARAVGTNRFRSVPSNVQTCTVLYNNPLPPPPSLLSPANGSTLTLPITFTWTDVINPQPLGYTIEVATDSGFSNIEFLFNQITPPGAIITSLTSGQKFWRVNSTQGDASPTTGAVTAWSSTGTFTIPSTAPKPVSVTIDNPAMYNGDTTFVAVQLTTAAGANGANIQMTSSNPNALAVPATIPMQGNLAWTQFQVQAGYVTSPTAVTLTATLNGVSASTTFNVLPPSLKYLQFPPSPSVYCGGVPASVIVMLNGEAGPNGAVVSLSSDSTLVNLPPSVTVPAGSYSTSFSVPTSPVTTKTVVNATASWQGASSQAQITLMPQGPPATITLYPPGLPANGSYGGSGTVTIASPLSYDDQLPLTCSDTADVTIDNFVTIPAGATAGSFNVQAVPTTGTKAVTISVSGGGVTKSATLTLNPTSPPGPTPSSLTLNPSTVVGGNNSQGTVTLSGPAPSGGAVVSLGAGTFDASVPSTVTVPSGSTSATFPITTVQVGSTVVINITAGLNSQFASAGLTINPVLTGPGISSFTLNPINVTGGSSSHGAVALNGPAPSGGAVVSLSSGNTSVAAVPSKVTIVAGATSASFTVTTASVTGTNVVNLSATYNSVVAPANLTVAPSAPPPPASLSSLTLNPTSVTGGNNSQGTVTLTSAAPSGGAVVSLSSGNTAIATVPASVTVAAGATSASFAVTTVSVTANTPVTLSATYSSVTKTATLTVTPPASGSSLSSLTLNPASVTGGNTSQGTVTLTSAAPSGGAVVTLRSGNTSVATVPASVTVAAGATSASFTVTTVSVTATNSVAISATYGGATKPATLAVTPASSGGSSLSSLTLNPTSVKGGNTSTGTVTLSSPAPSGGAVVSLSSSDTSSATVPGSVTVGAGATSASFTVNTQKVSSTRNVTISGLYGGVTQSATLTVTGRH